MHHWKRGKKWGFWSSISHPQSASSCPTVLSPLANIYGIYNQVKFLKLPVSLFSRPGGEVLFSTDKIIWLPPLFPPLAWRTLLHTQKLLLNSPNKLSVIASKAYP